MPAITQFLINPQTKDWSMTKGQPTEDMTLQSEVLFLLDHQRGSATAFPGWGSRLHTLTKMVPNVEDEAKAMCEEALQPMVSDGRLKDLTVSVTRPTPTYLEIIVTWRKTGSGQQPLIKKLLTLA